MTSKATPQVLSLQSRRSLTALFDELLALMDSLATASKKKNWNEVDDLVSSVKSYVRSIKEEIPDGLAKEQVRQLDAHAQFIETYARKRNDQYMMSNARAIRPDIHRLAAALGIGGEEELRAAIEALPSGVERDLLDEAVRCLGAESSRAAVVMAVCALETLLRRFYESKNGPGLA